jgi:RimJ/RimL family protein N-acetyltransferase
MDPKPGILEGEWIRLDPMRADHLEKLAKAGAFEELWLWTNTRADSMEGMREYVASALRDAEAGTALPFVTIDKESGEIIGSTRFAAIDRVNRRMEIGWTWITPEFQRTYANTEAKYLMLRYAFEELGCIRVELKTDVLNEKSRNAMLRFGAKEEGTLRQHIVTYTGRLRDTVYYSVLDREWPHVRERLKASLNRALL